ncbi:hypothetical protein JHW43_005829 [Diplocarpon mali]|nr:hypothetical protein JHW43_005829 [Diplocarpon mali]
MRLVTLLAALALSSGVLADWCDYGITLSGFNCVTSPSSQTPPKSRQLTTAQPAKKNLYCCGNIPNAGAYGDFQIYRDGCMDKAAKCGDGGAVRCVSRILTGIFAMDSTRADQEVFRLNPSHVLPRLGRYRYQVNGCGTSVDLEAAAPRVGLNLLTNLQVYPVDTVSLGRCFSITYLAALHLNVLIVEYHPSISDPNLARPRLPCASRLPQSAFQCRCRRSLTSAPTRLDGLLHRLKSFPPLSAFQLSLRLDLRTQPSQPSRVSISRIHTSTRSPASTPRPQPPVATTSTPKLAENSQLGTRAGHHTQSCIRLARRAGVRAGLGGGMACISTGFVNSLRQTTWVEDSSSDGRDKTDAVLWVPTPRGEAPRSLERVASIPATSDDSYMQESTHRILS